MKANCNVLINGEGAVSCADTAEDMAKRLVDGLDAGGQNLMMAIKRPDGRISYRLAGLIMGFDTVVEKELTTQEKDAKITEELGYDPSTDQGNGAQ